MFSPHRKHALAVLPLLLTASAWGQQTLGVITGVITDTSGAVIAGAVINFTNNGTSFTRQTTSSGSGSYAFQDLPISVYTVTVSREGFAPQTYPDIQVQANRSVSLNVQLKPGSASEGVTVQGSPLLNTVDTTNGYVMDNAQVEQIPLATGSFTQLAILAPGVNAAFVNGTGTNEGLGNQAIWANGQRATDNTFQFNGIETSNLFNGNSTSQQPSGRATPNTGGNFVSGGAIQTNTSVYDAIGNAIPTPPPEMIQELRVDTSMYDAQEGQTSGAHVNVSTLTGTNRYHGQAYLYRQTNWLNADPFFYNQQSVQYGGTIPQNQTNPQLHRFTSGATLGGPILKDKLFFFLGYNAVRVTDQFNGTSNLFLPSGLSNDRSPAGLTTAVNSTLQPTATPFAGNFDPAALALLQIKLANGQYLIPSVAGSNAGAQLANAQPDQVLFGKPSFLADQAVGNIDYNAAKNDVLSLKYFYQHDPARNPFTDSNVAGFDQQLDAGGQVGSIVNSYTPSAHFSWQQSFGVSREKAYSTNSQPFSPSAVGINLFGYTTFPGITVRDATGTGKQLTIGPTSDFFRDGVFQTRFAPGSSATSTFGAHTVSYGADYSYTQLNIVNRRQNTAQLNFKDFADLAAGKLDPARTTFLQGASSRYYRSNFIGAFAQDKWQLSPKLSITAGIRYDYDGPLYEKYGNLFNFNPKLYAYDPGTDTITNDGFIIAGNNKQYHTPGVSDSTLTGRQWGISPRIGFAFAPASSGGKVVFRGGFGLYYDRGEYFTYLSPGAGSGISGPFGVTQEPPLVVPVNAAKGATLSNPFGTTLPAPPTGNPQDFYAYLPTRAALEKGASTFPFGAYDITNKLPYTENYTFDMQWQPLSDIAITIGYVGNRGRHGVIPVPFNQPGIATASNPINGETSSYGYQAQDTNYNPVTNQDYPLTTEPYATNDGGNTDLRVPYLGYGVNSVSYRAAGNSAYDALQVNIQKRMHNGLQFGFSYTYAHSLDEQSGLGLFYNGSNPSNLRSGYGSSDFDLTHDVTFNYLYKLPDFVKSHNLVSRLTNGWALQGITVLQSGQPYSVEDYSGSVGSLYYSTNDGITNPIIPLAPGVSQHQALTRHSGAFLAGGTAVPALNSAAFVVPFVAPGDQGVPACGVSTAGAPVCDVYETGFGPGGQRNIFRQGFQKRADISFVKYMRVTERVSLKYTFDMYNATNTPSFDVPNNSVSANSNYVNTPAYDSTKSVLANQQAIYNINNDATIASGQGLGVVQQTIGSPRNIQMSLHLNY